MKNTFFALALLAVCVDVSQGADDDIKSIYDQCKDVKTRCVGKTGSSESSDWNSCDVMATIQANQDKSKFTFTMVGKTREPNNMYIALGISEDGNNMKDTLIVVCSNVNNAMGIFWAEDTTGPKTIGAPSNYKNLSIEYDAGNIICKFELPSKFESKKSFDLVMKNYAILLAQGKYEGDKPTQHSSSNRLRFDAASLIGPKSSTPDTTPESKGPGSSSSHLVTSYLVLVVFSLLGLKTWLL